MPHAPFRAEQIARGRPAPRAGRPLPHARATRADHTYPGNPEPLTFGETGERGRGRWSPWTDAGAVTRERHRVAVPQVSDVEVDLTGSPTAAEVQRPGAPRRWPT